MLRLIAVKRTLLFVPGVLVLFLVGCSAPRQQVNPATVTAVARQVIVRATDMAAQHQSTFAVADASTVATVQAWQAHLAVAQEWPVYFSDNFDDDSNENEWPTGAGDNPLAVLTQTIQLGKYAWEMKSKGGLVWWTSPSASDLNDFYVSVNARQVSGPAQGWIGLQFRKDAEDHHYLFKVEDDGYFSVLRYDGEWTVLIAWTAAEEIEPGGNNLLAVFAEGSHFVFLINGQQVAELDDTLISSGEVGVFAGLPEGGQYAEFEFDDFEVRVPDPGILTP